jgi:hypothetical protein
MLNVIYSIKVCMLIMFSRLTLGLQVQKMVMYLSIYVAIGWLATEIAFFTACRPFTGYWAMPPPDPQCTTLEHYAIVQGCFNISSDALMLLIPLPLVTRLNVPWKQKAVLMVIFSMGIFVILAAILTKVFNLSDIWDPSYMLWYTREASVAVYVANIPMIWPLLREWFPFLKAMTPGQKISSGKGAGYHHSSDGRVRTITNGGRRNEKFGGKRASDNGVITTIHGKGDSTEDLSSNDDTEMRDLERGSWEQHNSNMSTGDIGLVDSGRWDSQKDFRELKDGITLTTTVQISEEHVSDVASTDTQSRIVVASPMEKGAVGPGYKWDFHRDEKR